MDLETFLAEWHNDSPTVLVHTSGSTGEPKPMLVEKRRMEASARMTCQFLGLKKDDTALLCMPLDYIAGKMMVVRALTCGLRLINVEPNGHPMAEITQRNRPYCVNYTAEPTLLCNFQLSFAAMVPLQVWNSLQVPEERERLMQIRQLIIGGGAVDDELAQMLVDFPNQVWSTYGMTETLSHIALRRLNGPDASEWYTPFEGVNISQDAEGCLVIDAPAVCANPLTTNDIAIVEQGRFRIVGRRDNVVCSGGLKIQIEEVERQLRPYVRVPFIVTKRKDPKFGEALVMLTEGPVEAAKEYCSCLLPKHWQPRFYLHVSHVPLTETGKPARGQAQKIAEIA